MRGSVLKEFELIYNENFSKIFNFLAKLCSDHSLCEEMTQETFYQAFISLHRYNGSCEISTWLAAIAKNVYLKYLKKNKIKFVDIDLVVLADDEESPQRILEKRIEAKTVRRAVEALPQKYRDVVVLRIYAEAPYSEVAKLLKISENSAKVIFNRAKKILQKELFDEN